MAYGIDTSNEEYYIKDIAGEHSFYGWNWQEGVSPDITISYSFSSSNYSRSTGLFNSSPVDYDSISSANTQHQSWALETFDYIESITNITFLEDDKDDDITIATSRGLTYEDENASGATIAREDNSRTVGSDKTKNADVALERGEATQETVIQEILKAVGLRGLTEENDDPAYYNMNTTILSSNRPDDYFENGREMHYLTPGIFDIETLHFLYGADYSHNSGDTTYVLGDHRGVYDRETHTVWDGSGDDTIEAKNLYTYASKGSVGGFGVVGIEAVGAHIDLREGFGRAWNRTGDQYYSEIKGFELNSNFQLGNYYNEKILLAFGANIENAIGASGDDTINGNALDNNLYGRNGDDTIQGFGGDDRIYGEKGNDILHGGDGSDSLHGGEGVDILYGDSGVDYLGGDAGDDYLYGGYDTDFISGGEGNDVLYGEYGDDIIRGDEGNDILLGGRGNDYLFGGEGDDTFYGDEGKDTLNGGDGVDTADYSASRESVLVNLESGYGRRGDAEGDSYSQIENVIGSSYKDDIIGNKADNVLDGRSGNDTIHGGAGNDTLIGGYGQDVLFGGEGNDTFDGGSLSDFMFGETGEDTFIGGEGDDYIDGGKDNDTVSYTRLNHGLNIDLEAGTVTSSFKNDTLISVENAVGTSYDDTIVASNSGGILSGLDGDDFFVAGENGDAINGGEGNDTLSYERSTNAVNVNLHTGALAGGYAQGDSIVWSIENVIGSSYDDVFVSSSVDNEFDGGEGNDTLSYEESTSGVYAELALGTAITDNDSDQFTSIENLIGSDHEDVLIGTDADNTLSGGASDDILIGGIGADTIDGGEGNDTVSYEGSTEAVDVRLNVDRFSGGEAEGDVLTSIENIIGSAGDDRLQGTDDDNILRGGDGSDLINGYLGDDTIHGGDGDDSIYVTGGNNLLFGDYGNDTFYLYEGSNSVNGGEGNDTVSYFNASGAVDVNLNTNTAFRFDESYSDTLSSIENVYGSEFDDNIFGNDADNELYGRGGDDTLYGAGGADILNGSAGSDTFFYSQISDSTSEVFDTIRSFSSDQDVFLFGNGMFDSFDDLVISYNDSTDETIVAGLNNDFELHIEGNFDLTEGAFLFA